jgi:hypothetical protein
MTPSELNLATFRFVVQCLNHYATVCPTRLCKLRFSLHRFSWKPSGYMDIFYLEIHPNRPIHTDGFGRNYFMALNKLWLIVQIFIKFTLTRKPFVKDRKLLYRILWKSNGRVNRWYSLNERHTTMFNHRRSYLLLLQEHLKPPPSANATHAHPLIFIYFEGYTL